jgi:aryl-alcohol dehydrogenase-like predicted oxidoreductase
MPLNHYVTLGRSGLRVSPFCLGAMTFGGAELGWGCSAEESVALLDRYLELGGNFIDTANMYTNGRSEQILGEYVNRQPAKRDRLVLATKFSTNLHAGDPNGGGSNRKTIVAQCEASLRRLRTDYIDLYWLHCWDRHTPIEETMSALNDLVRSGKVRYLGVSNTPAWKVTQAQLVAQQRGWAPFIALQVEYSLLERTIEGELVPMAQELGLGITPWSPLRSGVLSGKYTRTNAAEVKANRGEAVTRNLDERTFRVIDELSRVASAHDTTVARVALSWVQSRPGVTSTILGARTLQHLEDNLKALDVRLSDEEVARLSALTTPALPFPHEILQMAPMIQNGGTMVNGESGEANAVVKALVEGP